MNGLEVLSARSQRNNIYGVVIGIVTNNKDPDGLGRVKIILPWLSENEESAWARVAVPMAGPDMGFYSLPEVDDEVLVAFEHGQVAYPYIVGALWNGKQKPPTANTDGKNNQRLIKSRSGHTILLDDTPGEEKIIVRDQSGKNEIEIDSKTNVITIKAGQDLKIEAQGNIDLNSSKDVSIICNNFKVKAQQNCEIKANLQAKLEASAGMNLTCMAGVKINNGALEIT
ncbi:MAG: phage tail protein [Phormidesmis priestleyi]|uniref:Phage tail protein n=1 Tax=Phormidesmis priestleyi TaxID=268141 RepID=A0A2W4X962_9CYAN|nr:MAG: phage tail protein [Phormidesmis priestleyi]